MTTVKIFFVFIYLKMEELGRFSGRFVKSFYKEWIRGFALSVVGLLSIVTVLGLGVLGVCHFFSKELVASFITHCITQSDGNFLIGVVGAGMSAGFVVSITILFCWWGLDTFKEHWCKVPVLIKDNWQKATHIVVGEK
jgi:hypothetical protein